MNRKFIIGAFLSVIFTTTVILTMCTIYGLHNLNSNVDLSNSNTNHAATYINASTITTTDGIKYIIDFGSLHSFLADTTIQRILQAEPATQVIPVMARTECPDGEKRFFDSKYRHPITLSDPDDGNPVTLCNAEFLSYPECSENIIGMDILHRFIVEYLYDEQILILNKTMPSGYVELGKMTQGGNSISAWMINSYSYYLDITIDHRISESFRIDTGHEMSELFVVVPPSDADPDIKVDLTKPHNCWIDVASRAGASQLVYTNAPNIDAYSLNPFLFFEQDFLIAFPDNIIYLRPTSTDVQDVYTNLTRTHVHNVP